MQQKKLKSVSQVHVLTNKIEMRFIPKSNTSQKKTIQTPQVKQQYSNIQNILFNALSFFKKKESIQNKPYQAKSQQLNENNSIQKKDTKTNQMDNIGIKGKMGRQERHQCRLKFACKIASQYILVGNEYQLDIINIGNINLKNYIQVQFVCSIQRKYKITHVESDEKKLNLLVVIAQKLLTVYRYDSRRISSQSFIPLKQILLQQQPVYLKVFKQGNFGLFYEKKIQIYIVTDQVRRRFNRPYKIPPQVIKQDSTFCLSFPPQIYENVVSIFFQEVKAYEQKQKFNLWSIQLQFLASQIKQNSIQRIYESKNQIKLKRRLYNYSKEVLLLNFGHQILAIKKGYVLDSATVNMKRQQSLLQYIGNDTLIHVREKRVQIYDFSINLLTKPYRIAVKSKDAININNINEDEQYFKTVSVLGNDNILIFQKKERENKFKNFQCYYYLYLTRGMSRQEKMKMIFPKNLKQFKIDDPVLQDKCDMAQKMGYSVKQIYYQLWCRSNQCEKEDYSLLIATRDYMTIQQEILKKLRKNSMLFKQILNVQQACLAMLSEKVYSTSCTKQLLMDYISSHFFRRKLILFKDIQMMEKLEKAKEDNDPSQVKLKMTIRQYQQLKSMEIKSQFIQYVNLFCHQNQKNWSKNMRFLLRNFKFVFRIIYFQLLELIIKNANVKLLDLLKQIPEILPYMIQQSQRPLHIPVGFYDGIWPPITAQQQKQSLHIDGISTIDNQTVIQEQLLKTISFKRNWLSQHDMSQNSLEQIRKKQQEIKSSHTFYFFLAKLFQFITDRQILQKIVDFIEYKYSQDDKFSNVNKSFRIEGSSRSVNLRSSHRSNKQNKITSLLPGMPQNLKGKVFLYQKIYMFFLQKNILPLKNNEPWTLSQFFELKDYQLIKYCFEMQRSIKGILLKNIKDIYKQCLPNHVEVFNKSILNYFISPLSQVSDLKYILNRINNQKQDFHRQNQQMYAVLIQALQRKLIIGTQDDIPIDQVLIYLQNIPLRTSGLNSKQANPTLQQLSAIVDINRYSDYLSNCKINMSIYDILHNPQQVFSKLVDYEIQKSQLEQSQVWNTIENFKNFAVDKLTQMQVFSQNIYHRRNTADPINYHTAIFFIFLAKICENIDKIPFVRYLLSQQFIKRSYDLYIADAVVQYMYQWIFSKNNRFYKNKQYIQQLLTLLPQGSNTYEFISNQLEFATLLSDREYFITFPISSQVISFKDLKNIINCLSLSTILDPVTNQLIMPIQKVYKVTRKIQDVICEETDRRSEEQFDIMKIQPNRKITLHQVYEIFILRLLNQNKIKQSIPLIKQILQLECEYPTLNIIYPIIFIIHISNQLNEGNKENLIQCVWYYFYKPSQLMEILQYIITTPLSPHQMRSYIERVLQEGKNHHQGYNQTNNIFRKQYIQFVQTNADYKPIFMKFLIQTSRHIQECKDQFKHIKYAMIMAMLCNQPFALAKFISCSDQRNVRPIRSLLSYAIMEDVFEPLALLEQGRRIFLVLLEMDTKQFPIQNIAQDFKKLDFNDDAEINQYQPPQQTDTFQYVMWKSSQAFRKKKQSLRSQIETGGKKSKQYTTRQNQRKSRIKKIFLQAEKEEKDRQASQYIFSDSDNQQCEDMEIKQFIRLKKQRPQSFFEPKSERVAIFESKKFKKPFSLYKSIQGDSSMRLNNRLYVSTKQKSLSKVTNQMLNTPDIIGNRKARSAISDRSSYEEGLQKMPLSIKGLSHDFQIGNVQRSNELQVSYKREELQNLRMSPTNSLPNIPQIEKQSPLIHYQLQGQNQNQFVTNSFNYQSLQNVINQNHDSSNSHNVVVSSQSEMLSKHQHSKENFMKVHQIKLAEVDSYTQNPKTELAAEQPKNNNLFKQIATKLLEVNKQPLQTGNEQEYQFEQMDKYEQNPQALKQIIKQIYNQKSHESNHKISQILNMINQIINRYMDLGISTQKFIIFKRMQQVQTKTIPDIKFTSLISDQALVKSYQSQREIFDQMYKNLLKFIDSQNIYTIQKFVHKVFDNSEFEKEVLMDFVLDICCKLNTHQQQQRKWNIEKIAATLPKIDVKIWNNKFDNFERKVLNSPLRDQILQIFCQLLDKKQSEQGIKFLTKVQNLYHHSKVSQKLKQLQD